MEISPVKIETVDVSSVPATIHETEKYPEERVPVTPIEEKNYDDVAVKQQASEKKPKRAKHEVYDEEEDITPVKKQAPKKKPKRTKHEVYDEESDVTPVKKPAPKKQAPKRRKNTDEDPKKQAPKKKPKSKKQAEDDAPQAPKKTKKTPTPPDEPKKTKKQTTKVQVHPDPARNREINNILKRLHNNSNITTALIVDALRSRKNILDIESKLPMIKERIDTKFQNSLEELEEGPQKAEKMAKLEEAHKKKVEKFVKIELFLKKTERVSLKPADELYLSKYPVPVKTSGFMLYSKDTRPEVKKEYPEATFGTIGRHIGEKWRGLSEDDKRVWRQKADPTAV